MMPEVSPALSTRNTERSLFQFFDELPDSEYASLKADIAARGVLVPIELDEQGSLLDGHHRRRACEELGIKDYPTVVRRFSSQDEKEEHVVTLNLRRRHLNGEQKRKWAEWFLRRHPEWSNRRVASEVGLTDPTVAKVRQDLEADGLQKFSSRVGKNGVAKPAASPPKPTPQPSIFTTSRQAPRAQTALDALGDAAPPKQMDVKRAERMARDADAERRRAEPTDPQTVHGTVDIRHGDFREVLADIPDGSVDLVFTDPPYPAEFLPLWSDLGAFAAAKLKPGGLLIAYTGQLFLPDVVRQLGEHLGYWWCGAVTHVGAFFQLRMRHMQVGWKPVLMYRRDGGSDLPPWTNDIVTEGTREKSGHDWQQSEAEAAYWLDKLTEPGDLVVDPFLGSGTTAAVANRLGRRLIGCDVDPLAIQRTRERVA